MLRLPEGRWDGSGNPVLQDSREAPESKILILITAHGASHRRAANALHKALLEICPALAVEVVDGLDHCAGWFRAYYNSYEIPLRYWPSLWQCIESFQHQQASTGPAWLYRSGARGLFRFIQEFQPEIVIASEVGMCELAAMLKRETDAGFYLVGLELMDFNRAWVQPEVDLYLATHGDLAAELESAGAPHSRIICSGQPVDPAFASLPEREAARARLGAERDIPLLLVLFGGTGFGKPNEILRELNKFQQPLQVVFITGTNPRLEKEIRDLSQSIPLSRVLGWVDNMHEWMVAADLLVSKPGGSTLTEAFACGLPMLAFCPLPGNEVRTCDWIEKWEVGYWVRRPADLMPTIHRLLENREELRLLRERALALARPHAASDAAEAILQCSQRWPHLAAASSQSSVVSCQ